MYLLSKIKLLPILGLIFICHEAVGGFGANLYLSEASKTRRVRAVEWTAALDGLPLGICARNKDPATDTCFIEFSCSIKNFADEKYAVASKFQMTDVDVRDVVLSELVNFSSLNGLNGCYPGNKYRSGPFVWIGAINNGDVGPMNPRSEFFIFNSRSDAETSNTVCNVLNPQLEANFGDIMYDSVDGAQKELSLQIQCQAGNGYAKVSTTGYNANDGIRLREDGSLNALVMVNNAPADFTASLFIEKNTTRNVPIIVTLKKTPALKGGIFSASMVFNVSYD
ncbi:MrpH family fimbial adhesin [Serratia fonticola]|jgi:hypothetical protein|uniref:MrpH family fimbial adhesin n=1 Tax=Serratia fonticola TaxID=47917 RepID=UPI000FB0FE7B|nr:hypothetical protein [Serratia fonticola]CAI1611538.1 Uncharacterised protein [Serratia fonticola]HBE9178085.1 hypothetical protein [Serratia fonticola]